MTSTAIFVPAPAGSAPTIHPVAEPLVTRIWLPAGYDPGRATGYQSLYLLHGGNGGYTDWADDGHLVQNTAGSPFHGIYVMPAGGLSGWYSDWTGHTDGFFAPECETFHTGQLVPWIDANFHTIADRSARAVAGARRLRRRLC
ncbi:S-formylglutathione hydrolase FrmB [Catenulispora sp. GP43]|uniref:alpha/beta hydrolase-fold protein n=1 Tax=Catenulispora sp. GP43 TaxID=3156263 RepID=UPI00351277F8